MSQLIQAIRYPWQGENWFGRMLPIALLQLVPLVGQLILLGYGLAVARAVQGKEHDLPTLAVGRALLDGLRLVGLGLLFLFPVLLMVLMALGGGAADSAENGPTVPGFVFPAVMLSYSGITRLIAKRRPASKPTLAKLNKLFTLLFIGFVLLRLRGLVTLLRTEFQLSALQFDPSAAPVLLIACLLFIVICAALLVVGVQSAVSEGKPPNPRSLLAKMIAKRQQTLQFIGTVWLLALGTLLLSTVGLLLFVVPGLWLLVAGSASIWFVATRYAAELGERPLTAA